MSRIRDFLENNKSVAELPNAARLPRSSISFKNPEVESEFEDIDPSFKDVALKAPPGIVTSGRRSKEENAAVGGVPNSYHTKGLALDYRKTPNISDVKKYYSDLGYDTLDEGDHLHVEPRNGMNLDTTKKVTPTGNRIASFLNPKEPGFIDKATDYWNNHEVDWDKINDYRKSARDTLASAAPRLNKWANVDAPSSGGDFLARNLTKTLNNIVVGFPTQAAAAALNIPEEFNFAKEKPKEYAKEVLKETGDQLRVLDPREYSWDKIKEDPFGKAANFGMATGLLHGAASSIPKIKLGVKSHLLLPQTEAGFVGELPEPTKAEIELGQRRELRNLKEDFSPTAQALREQGPIELTRPGESTSRALAVIPKKTDFRQNVDIGPLEMGDPSLYQPGDRKFIRNGITEYVPEKQSPSFLEDPKNFSDVGEEPFQNKSIVTPVKEPVKAPQVKTLTNFIRDTGGVWDEAHHGELRDIGTIKESGYNLLNKNGETLDVKRERANENDFGPYETISDFLDAIRRDVFSKINKGQGSEIKKGDEGLFPIERPIDAPAYVERNEVPYPENFSASPEELPKKSARVEWDPAEAYWGDLISKATGGQRGAVNLKSGIASETETASARQIQREAQLELFRRASKIAHENGITLDEALKQASIPPELAAVISAVQQSKPEEKKAVSFNGEFAQKLNSKGEPVDIKVGSERVPEKLVSIAPELKDISPIQGQYKDFDRIVEKVAKKNYPEFRDFLVAPREEAVTNLMTEVSGLKQQVKDTIINGLGIKPKSKESAAVMRFGEKRMNLDELKKGFPKNWENIVKADQFFRANYDKILEETNQVLTSQNRKPIPKRQDYYTHTQEIASLWDQLKNPAAIDPQLAGLSEFTKPTQRWNPFAQKRKGGKFTEDAIESFDRYLMPTLMQKHLTPVISRYRAFADALAQKTLETRNLNNFIGVIHDHANSLAGKTNPLDRYLQDRVIGRKAMRVIDWANQRFGANTIVGNLSSVVMQSGSLPVTAAHAGIYNTLKGMLSSVADAAKGKDTAFEMSDFLKRRYSDVKPLKKTLTQKSANVASIPLETFEKFIVESAWRANFSKALQDASMKEAVKLADVETMRQIGGRAIGEKPLLFQSRAGNMATMFQLEVNNLMQRYFQDLGAKKGLQPKSEIAKLVIYSHMFNLAMQQLMNRKPIFDPAEAVADAATMDKNKKDSAGVDIGKRLGRVAGEFLSNMAGGQTAAALIPENARKKYFGRTELGMYGGGPPVVGAIQRGIKDPASIITSFGLPFGGGQINKTLRGLKAVDENDLTPAQVAQAVTLGPYAAGLSKKKNKWSKQRETRR